ncbi:ATP-binding protein [Brachyspira pilosicoli]|uniref:ATP-binding protein n=1 Tax=Brachyspira pilosicoli TaxID=52584 RepID=UPI002542793D|nr:ATP-binding protein [Brachyspira pilosicoli]WIH85025.1 ATP-binding protein [Brachyspira pilosicoli]
MKYKYIFRKRKRKHKKFYIKIRHDIYSRKKFKFNSKKNKKNKIATGTIYKKSIYNKKIYKIAIDAPETLSFDNDNMNSTLEFFNKIRDISDNKKRLFIKMKYLKYITPAAALVLVSELDRLCCLHKTKIGVVDFNKWDNNIKNIFNDIGMYDFLDIKLSRKKRDSLINSNVNSNIIYLKFKSGINIDDGEKLEILNEIETIINNNNNNNNNINGKKTLKVGITEAILNTHHHAYPDNFINNSIYKDKKWWILGYINMDDNNIKIMIYDQGITIPDTLDEKKYMIFNKNDAEKIYTAVETDKSSTNMSNRGMGLQSIKMYAKKSDNGELVIISKKGYYKYAKNIDKIDSKLLKLDLKGTLISWNGSIESEINIDETLYEEE